MQLRTTHQGEPEMKGHVSVVTRKGQITIPADIRRALNINEGDKVAITLDEKNEVKVTRTGSIVAATAGALSSDRPPLSAEEERSQAEEAIAKDVVGRIHEK